MVSISLKEHEVDIIWNILISSKFPDFLGESIAAIFKKIIQTKPGVAKKLKKSEFNKWIIRNNLPIKSFPVRVKK